MKKIYIFVPALFLVVLIAMPALPDHARSRLSSTKSFSIDGKKFLVEKRGDGRHADSVFADSLREVGGSNSSNPIPLPQGLRVEHSLRMESESGQVDIVFGTMETRSPGIRRNMSSSGWECIEPGTGITALATMKKGRETTIVLLEEKEGKFLLLRRPE
jgi:hypothetical protein